MLESLAKIQNPFARSLTAAATIASVLVLTSSVVLGATHAKDRSAYKTALYFSLIGTGCAAIAGFLYPTQKTQQQPISKPLALTNSNEWKDWRKFVVVRKVQESDEITSFYLQPEDKKAILPFQPGQFLPIKLDILGQIKPIIRTYSLSDYPESENYYRLSIKRELMPKGLDVPPGIASNFMHDHIQEGSVILAKPPSGTFILEVARTLPAVFISNGVGITPMIAMAKAATRLNPNRPLWFFHGARDGRVHAFRSEINVLAEQNPHLKIHFAYSRPRSEDTGYFHSEGYINPALIRSQITADAEYFLCGSPPFMDSIREGLKSLGIPDNQVYFEMFTKAVTAKLPLSSSIPEQGAIASAEIVFSQSQKTGTWQATTDNLLEFAEALALNPPYSCRQGICGTCECRLIEGEIKYSQPPTAAIAEGSVLICIARPQSPKVVLDL